MKNEVNRALVAKKKNYINPEVHVAQFASMALMQAQAASTQSMGMYDIDSDQW